jgi:peptidoglycan/xylan/chitin deacetylase (PgdA/CDA1 family)
MIELYKNSGHEVATHGYTHPFLEKLDSAEVIKEITEDRRELERMFGTIVRGHAYPFGTYSDEVVSLLSKCGIAYARTTKSTGTFAFPENWLMLHPTCHHKMDLMTKAREFVENNTKYRHPLMLYVWGHTYEFDDNDNWNIIEEFAEYIGNSEDLWYATNIEIYDYVMAYKSLQTNYDKTLVYNPSQIKVWFLHNEKVYSVGGGETTTIV